MGVIPHFFIYMIIVSILLVIAIAASAFLKKADIYKLAVALFILWVFGLTFLNLFLTDLNLNFEYSALVLIIVLTLFCNNKTK